MFIKLSPTRYVNVDRIAQVIVLSEGMVEVVWSHAAASGDQVSDLLTGDEARRLLAWLSADAAEVSDDPA